MLNLIVKAASGTGNHNVLFDTLFGIERPDFLSKCPETYINGTFAEMAKIIDLKSFKKEAVQGFSKMGLDGDVEDCIAMAINEAKTATEVARLIYGIGVYLLTDLGETDPEMVQVLADRWASDNVADSVKGDGFYTVEAEQAMFDLCERIFGAKTTATNIHETVVDEPVVETAPTQQATQTEQAKPTGAGTIRGIKPQQHKNKKPN